jgi:transcription initiation factor TFIID TATA-box-binding protein
MKKSENTVLKIVNIVASGSVADAIDLEFISNSITDCTFTKRSFPGAVYHMQNPKSAALIFSSGRVVITGVLRFEDVAVALQNLMNSLKDAGITVLDKPHVKITNMVCSYNLGYTLNLNRVVVTLMDSEDVEYEPEVFPGLVCRISEPKIVFLLFSSGKIIITGGKNIENVKKGLDILKEKLSIVYNDPSLPVNEKYVSDIRQSIPIS